MVTFIFTIHIVLEGSATGLHLQTPKTELRFMIFNLYITDTALTVTNANREGIVSNVLKIAGIIIMDVMVTVMEMLRMGKVPTIGDKILGVKVSKTVDQVIGFKVLIFGALLTRIVTTKIPSGTINILLLTTSSGYSTIL